MLKRLEDSPISLRDIAAPMEMPIAGSPTLTAAATATTVALIVALFSALMFTAAAL